MSAVLIGGGSGVVPLMAMLRLARRKGVAELLRLVVSVRKPDDSLTGAITLTSGGSISLACSDEAQRNGFDTPAGAGGAATSLPVGAFEQASLGSIAFAYGNT